MSRFVSFRFVSALSCFVSVVSRFVSFLFRFLFHNHPKISPQVPMQTTIYRWSCQVSAKSLVKLLTLIFTAVKICFHRYHDTSFSGSGFNQIWILKISKDSEDSKF